MAFKQNYFSAIVGTEVGFTSGRLRSLPPTDPTDTSLTMRYGMDVTLPTQDLNGREMAEVRFYFGPNDASVLKTTGWGEIGRVIDFGWWIFGWINRNVIFPIYAFLAGHIGSAGLIVLVLTLLIKSVLFPITWKNYVSSAKMRVLKPDLQVINEKYPDQDDAMQRQQETMKLYRQRREPLGWLHSAADPNAAAVCDVPLFPPTLNCAERAFCGPTTSGHLTASSTCPSKFRSTARTFPVSPC